MFTAKKAPAYILAALIFVFAVWNCFAANVMEQFVHFYSVPSVIGGVARWIGLTGFVILPVALLFREPRCRVLAVFVILPAILAGLFVSAPYFAAHRATPAEFAAYVLFNASSFAACLYLLSEYIRERFFPERLHGRGVSARSAAALFFLLFLGCAPLNFFMQFPALMRVPWLRFRLFGSWHILFVVMLVLTTLFLVRLFKYKTQEEKFFAMLYLSGALFFQLAARFSFVRLQDYQTSHGIIGALPLYVCSFGIALLPFAILSRSHTFRCILFLINTPGAIIAFVWPTIGNFSVLHYNTTYFVYSHVLLFAITANLVATLGARPSFVHFKKLAYMIPCYYFAMLLLNSAALLGNPSYDPNFSFVSKSPLPVPFEKMFPLRIGHLSFSPLYLLILCAVQFALAFLTLAVFRLLTELFSDRKKSSSVSSD